MRIVFNEEDFITELKDKGNCKKTISSQINIAKRILAISPDWELGSAKRLKIKMAEEKSEATANKFVQCFKNLALINDIPWVDDLKKMKENNQPKDTLGENEFWDFFNINTGDKYNVAWRLILMSGARGSEILKLQRKHVDLNRGCIFLPPEIVKTRKGRFVFWQPFFQEEMSDFVEKIRHNDYLFAWRKKSLSIRSLEKDCAERLKLLGIDKNVTPHSFRHDYITRMASEVSNVLALKELAGHAKTSTTEKYYRNNYYLLKRESVRDPRFGLKNVEFTSIEERINKLIQIVTEYCIPDDRINMVEIQKGLVHFRASIKKT